MPKIVVALLARWQEKFGHHHKVLFGWLYCLMWCIWQRGITDVFKTLKKTIADLKLFFFITLSDWMSIIGSHSIFSVYYLMDAYNLCIWLFWSPTVYLGDSFSWLWIKILLLINNLKKKNPFDSQSKAITWYAFQEG